MHCWCSTELTSSPEDALYVDKSASSPEDALYHVDKTEC